MLMLDTFTSSDVLVVGITCRASSSRDNRAPVQISRGSRHACFGIAVQGSQPWRQYRA